MSDLYRVGIIGSTGRGDYGHGMDVVWKEISRCQVAAIADDNPDGLDAAQQASGAEHAYADYREMLANENLDIVCIGPRWVDRHHEFLMAAAEHGCHIYMEKPFVRDLVEADEVINACEMRHLKLAIAHQTGWSPPVLVAQQLVRDGLIGDILEMRGRGKEDATRGGGEDFWVLGSHILDLMRIFAGDPTDCYARMYEGGEPVNASHVHEGNEGLGPLAGDCVQARYSFANNVMGTLNSHRGTSGDPSRFGLTIYGTKGVLEVLTGHPSNIHVLVDSSWSPGRSGLSWQNISSQGLGVPETLENTGLHGGNLLAVNDLLDCIENPDQLPQCSMFDARWIIEMIMGAFESHRTGGVVTFPLTQRRNALGML